MRAFQVGGCLAMVAGLIASSNAAGQCEVVLDSVVEPVSGERFGHAIAMSSDGSLLAVGAPGATDATGIGTGAVYVYARAQGGESWTNVQTLRPTNPEVRKYGQSLHVLGNQLLVAGALDPDSDGDGIPTADLFNAFPGGWSFAGSYSSSSSVAVETIVAKMGRVELARGDTGPTGSPGQTIFLGGVAIEPGTVSGQITVASFRFDSVAGWSPAGVLSTSGTGNLYEEINIKPIRLELARGGGAAVAIIGGHRVAGVMTSEAVIFDRNGDTWAQGEVIRASQLSRPVSAIFPTSWAAVLDSIVPVGIDQAGDVVMAALEVLGGEGWQQTDQQVLASGAQTNPLYQSSTMSGENPLFAGRSIPIGELLAHGWGGSGDGGHVVVYQKTGEPGNPVNWSKLSAISMPRPSPQCPSNFGSSVALGSGVLAVSCSLDDDCDGIAFRVDLYSLGRCLDPVDWDASGGVNSDDFFSFLTDFFAGNADFDRNEQTNSDDFFAFLDGFFSRGA